MCTREFSRLSQGNTGRFLLPGNLGITFFKMDAKQFSNNLV